MKIFPIQIKDAKEVKFILLLALIISGMIAKCAAVSGPFLHDRVVFF